MLATYPHCDRQIGNNRVVVDLTVKYADRDVVLVADTNIDSVLLVDEFDFRRGNWEAGEETWLASIEDLEVNKDRYGSCVVVSWDLAVKAIQKNENFFGDLRELSL